MVTKLLGESGFLAAAKMLVAELYNLWPKVRPMRPPPALPMPLPITTPTGPRGRPKAAPRPAPAMAPVPIPTAVKAVLPRVWRRP